MKAKIQVALTNKYKNLGVGAKAIEAAATYLEASVKEESEIDAAVVAVEPILKAFQSEADTIRTAKTEAEKKAAELEAKIKSLAGGDDGKGDGTEGKEGDDKTPEWAKALLDSNQKLTERLNTIEGEKITSTRRQQLDAIVEKLPEQLRKPYARMDIKSLSDEAFTELTNEVTAEVDGIIENSTKEGLSFSVPAGSKGSGGKGDDIDSLVGSIEKGTKEQVEQLKTGK